MKIRIETENGQRFIDGWFITLLLILLCVVGMCMVTGYVGLFEYDGAWEVM